MIGRLIGVAVAVGAASPPESPPVFSRASLSFWESQKGAAVHKRNNRPQAACWNIVAHHQEVGEIVRGWVSSVDSVSRTLEPSGPCRRTELSGFGLPNTVVVYFNLDFYIFTIL